MYKNHLFLHNHLYIHIVDYLEDYYIYYSYHIFLHINLHMLNFQPNYHHDILYHHNLFQNKLHLVHHNYIYKVNKHHQNSDYSNQQFHKWLKYNINIRFTKQSLPFPIYPLLHLHDFELQYALLPQSLSEEHLCAATEIMSNVEIKNLENNLKFAIKIKEK